MRVTQYKTMLTEDKKVKLEKEFSVNAPTVDKVMNSPEKVSKLAYDILRLHEQTEEYLYMVCLNTKCALTSVFELSHGNVNSSIFSVRETLQKALLANAVSIIVMHNHPSGDPTPSKEDVDVTKRLGEAGKIVGIQLLDHLIIGDGRFCSLKEKGYI